MEYYRKGNSFVITKVRLGSKQDHQQDPLSHPMTETAVKRRLGGASSFPEIMVELEVVLATVMGVALGAGWRTPKQVTRWMVTQQKGPWG